MHDFVVHLPLRKLEHTRDLKQLLFDEYFSFEPKGDKSTDTLTELILKEGNDSKAEPATEFKILLILDSLEETAGWSAESCRVLLNLISQPTVVITSRFDVVEKVKMKPIDLNMKATGLNMDNSWAHTRNSSIVSTKNASGIRRSIQINHLVREMMRVPIHLEILAMDGRTSATEDKCCSKRE